ncbi:MAG: hypothetical protein IJ774_03650 [Selenomonadaceae bacterium]|nr:hypothetical protein [Selenomonadaceae bacterium]
MAFNNRALFNQDCRRIFSGKDAVIFSGDTGELLSTVETFQAQVNIATAQYQVLGSPLQSDFITGYAVTLTITECIIESHQFIRELFDMFTNGRHSPHWCFKSTIYGYQGSEETIIYRDCVPSGQIDLHNLSVGDIVKRSWSLHVNQPPELQKLLSYT